jgi:hypothetical protein
MPKKSEACPRCKKVYVLPYLYEHMRKQHGIYGGSSGMRRDDLRRDRAALATV